MNRTPRRKLSQKRILPLWLAMFFGVASAPAFLNAATPLVSIDVSPDITVTLATTQVGDESVAEDDLTGTIALVSLGPLPASADVDAYQFLPGSDRLFSLDTTVDLGFPAAPADVVRWDGVAYSREFDAEANGVPASANVDAVTREREMGDLLLSFDTTVDLAGTLVEDEDLVRFDGLNFTLFFDGTAAGVPATLDLDGAYLLFSGHLLLSFDGSGNVAGVTFDDEDVLEYNPALGTWELTYDGSMEHASWVPADLDTLYASADFDGDGAVDDQDNCITLPNGPLIPDAGGNSQLDTDDDGYGNRCDADLNQTGFVDFSDLTLFSNVFFTPDADADLNGTGFVDFSDLTLFSGLFFQVPGPSCCAQ